ncbi:hypothetical protein [Bradyrhizobium sp.]
MKTLLLLAGLPKEVVEKIRQESSKRFVPNGNLLIKPLADKSYTQACGDELLEITHECVLSYPENQPLSIIIGYVDSRSSDLLLSNFFPFALPFRLNAFIPDWSRGKNSRNQSLNKYMSYLSVRSRETISLSYLVKKIVDVRNLTPLLLPRTNFKSMHLNRLLVAIFSELELSPDPEKFLNAEIDRFLLHHPYRTPDGDSRRCLCNGDLHFKSPGNNRHGFLRNSDAKNHELWCLLNARSRLGAPYDHSFHFDCVPLRGPLAASYVNCHSVPIAPKPTHVNIAPNDYIS